jgi:predicted DNA-binding WGR domain protein
MKRIKAEILHYKQGRTHDKVYIVEVLKEKGRYYVYSHYGKRLQENLITHLKVMSDFEHVAEENFEKLVRDKVKKGYKYVPNGTRLDIPGFKDAVVVHNILEANSVKKIEKEPKAEEHRRLVI